MTHKENNEIFNLFVKQMLFLRLINSGQSNMSSRQSELVKKAFDNAYQIILVAKGNKNPGLFNRVYHMAQELVPSVEMIKCMKYPEMYNEMQNAHMCFNNKVATLLRQHPSFQAMMYERGN